MTPPPRPPHTRTHARTHTHTRTHAHTHTHTHARTHVCLVIPNVTLITGSVAVTASVCLLITWFQFDVLSMMPLDLIYFAVDKPWMRKYAWLRLPRMLKVFFTSLSVLEGGEGKGGGGA